MQRDSLGDRTLLLAACITAAALGFGYLAGRLIVEALR